jgi:hypothetical protein
MIPLAEDGGPSDVVGHRSECYFRADYLSGVPQSHLLPFSAPHLPVDSDYPPGALSVSGVILL